MQISKLYNFFFHFLDDRVNFALLRREYFSSAVSVLTNSSKISDITKRVIF